MANSVDHDQIMHSAASDVAVNTVCAGLSVPILRVITISSVPLTVLQECVLFWNFHIVIIYAYFSGIGIKRHKVI